MDAQHRGRKIRWLWAMVVLAVAYSCLLFFLGTLTGAMAADGVIGIILGLYISSHPAANMIDMMYYDRAALHELSKEWSGLGWLTLNLMTMICGWIVLVIGIVRVVGRV